MTDPHTEMHEIYSRINSMWSGVSPVITDRTDGKIAEVIRWCRDRLGGRDQDLVGPERWENACRDGWSEQATYSCLPSPKREQTWSGYVHDIAHWLYPMLPSDDRFRRYGDHDVGHARLELELTKLVLGWLIDEANGIKRSFPPLKLLRPPDLRRAQEPHTAAE
jgi:hypothetical protein